jgi:hypothetical protein
MSKSAFYKERHLERISCRLVKTGDTVEIAPGQETDVSVPRSAVPQYGFVKLMRQGDGSYLPVLKTWSETIRLRESTPTDLGLDISYMTLKRLIVAGFIRGRLIAPDTCLLDLASLYEHIERCQDFEFWTEENRAEYRSPASKDFKN